MWVIYVIWITWIFFCKFLKKPLELFQQNFCLYITLENQSNTIAWSHLKITWIVLNAIFFNKPGSKITRLHHNPLELWKSFVNLKDRKLQDRAEKNRRKIKELFYKSVVVLKDDTDRFEEQEIKKIKPIRKTWFDQLIKQSVMKKKSKVVRDK